MLLKPPARAASPPDRTCAGPNKFGDVNNLARGSFCQARLIASLLGLCRELAGRRRRRTPCALSCCGRFLRSENVVLACLPCQMHRVFLAHPQSLELVLAHLESLGMFLAHSGSLAKMPLRGTHPPVTLLVDRHLFRDAHLTEPAALVTAPPRAPALVTAPPSPSLSQHFSFAGRHEHSAAAPFFRLGILQVVPVRARACVAL